MVRHFVLQVYLKSFILLDFNLVFSEVSGDKDEGQGYQENGGEGG